MCLNLKRLLHGQESFLPDPGCHGNSTCSCGRSSHAHNTYTHSRLIYSRGNAFYVISFWCSVYFLKNTFRAKILLIPTIQLLTIVSFVLMFKNSDFRIFNLETPLADVETPINKFGPNIQGHDNQQGPSILHRTLHSIFCSNLKVKRT